MSSRTSKISTAGVSIGHLSGKPLPVSMFMSNPHPLIPASAHSMDGAGKQPGRSPKTSSSTRLTQARPTRSPR